MFTLTILDYTAELIELTYDMGSFTRKHIVPAVVTVYVALAMTIEYFIGLRGPTRLQMIDALTKEWKAIVRMDPEGDVSESIEFVWFLESLTDKELVAEYQGL